MDKNKILSKLNFIQKEIYRRFDIAYPLITDAKKTSFLKLTHFRAQYETILNESDNGLLLLLPPEPASPTAMQLAFEIYNKEILGITTFKILLPFIMYDLANPKSGSLPQCNRSNYESFNQFELLISLTRTCITDYQEEYNNPEICKKFLFSSLFGSMGTDEYDDIISSAQKFLGMHNLDD